MAIKVFGNCKEPLTLPVTNAQLIAVVFTRNFLQVCPFLQTLFRDTLHEIATDSDTADTLLGKPFNAGDFKRRKVCCFINTNQNSHPIENNAHFASDVRSEE